MTSNKPVGAGGKERMIPNSGSDGPLGAAREMQGWVSKRFATTAREGGPAHATPCSKKVRRYTVCREVAYGGTATIHLGLLEGAAGFRRPVAIKRIREGLPKERQLSSGLRREALLGCHIRHPNVVPVLDLLQADGELLLVMEFVLGETLARLQKAGGKLPLPIIVAILSGVLRGLHAAHTATGDSDEPLKIVHRDVSPQNVLVGADGIARIIDFGVAKAVSTEPTSVGYLKGKIGYFAPEQFLDEPLDARTDVFAAGIVLWEAVAGRRLFQERNPIEGVLRFLSQGVEPASRYNPDVPRELDSVLARALQRSPEWRFESAERFAEALESVVRPASPGDVAAYLRRTAGAALDAQRALLASVQLPGRAPPAMPPLATAHGSVSFPALESMAARDEESTVVQRPLPPRAGMLSAPDDLDDDTEVATRPEPFEPGAVAPAVEFQDSTKVDRFSRLRHALREVLTTPRGLVLGLAVGVVFGAVSTSLLSEPQVIVTHVSAAARHEKGAPRAAVPSAAITASASASEPALLVPVSPETLELAPTAVEVAKSRKSAKRAVRSKAPRARAAKPAALSAPNCNASTYDASGIVRIDPRCL